MSAIPSIQLGGSSLVWTGADPEVQFYIRSDTGDVDGLRIIPPGEGRDPSFSVELTFAGSQSSVYREGKLADEALRDLITDMNKGLTPHTLVALPLVTKYVESPAQIWQLRLSGEFWVEDTTGPTTEYYPRLPNASVMATPSTIAELLAISGA